MIELVAVLAVAAILVALFLPAILKTKAKPSSVKCVNNLKNVGLSFRIFATDNQDKFPMLLSITNGGSMEYLSQPFSAFRHFTAVSNELSTPVIIVCPEDSGIPRATNFASLQNSNNSYFVGIDSKQERPTMILAGDKGIQNGSTHQNGFLNLTSNLKTVWLGGPHDRIGNLCMADGSVNQSDSKRLSQIVKETGDPTNRIALPLFP